MLGCKGSRVSCERNFGFSKVGKVIGPFSRLAMCAEDMRQNIPLQAHQRHKCGMLLCLELQMLLWQVHSFYEMVTRCGLCLYICAVYCVVHLELASSMSIDSFNQIFTRFISRCRWLVIVYSDNGTNT